LRPFCQLTGPFHGALGKPPGRFDVVAKTRQRALQILAGRGGHQAEFSAPTPVLL